MIVIPEQQDVSLIPERGSRIQTRDTYARAATPQQADPALGDSMMNLGKLLYGISTEKTNQAEQDEKANYQLYSSQIANAMAAKGGGWDESTVNNILSPLHPATRAVVRENYGYLEGQKFVQDLSANVPPNVYSSPEEAKAWMDQKRAEALSKTGNVLGYSAGYMRAVEQGISSITNAANQGRIQHWDQVSKDAFNTELANSNLKSYNPQYAPNRADAQAVIQTAGNLKMDPRALSAILALESSHDPTAKGGKDNLYEGIIQFGPYEQQKYHVNRNTPLPQQLAATEAFLRDRGFKASGNVEQDIRNAYKAINPGAFNSDEGEKFVQSMLRGDKWNEGLKFLGLQNTASSFGQGLVPQSGGMAGAADLAASMEGHGPGQVSAKLGTKMSDGEWCTDFVNGTLQKYGVKGSGSSIATSYLKWGSAVNPTDLAKGDVLVEARGHAAGETGGHVALATGNVKRDASGKITHYEAISGNYSDSVKREWLSASNVTSIRRDGSGGDAPAGKPMNFSNTDPAQIPYGDQKAQLSGVDIPVDAQIMLDSFARNDEKFAAKPWLKSTIKDQAATAFMQRAIDEKDERYLQAFPQQLLNAEQKHAYSQAAQHIAELKVRDVAERTRKDKEAKEKIKDDLIQSMDQKMVDGGELSPKDAIDPTTGRIHHEAFQYYLQQREINAHISPTQSKLNKDNLENDIQKSVIDGQWERVDPRWKGVTPDEKTIRDFVRWNPNLGSKEKQDISAALQKTLTVANIVQSDQVKDTYDHRIKPFIDSLMKNPVNKGGNMTGPNYAGAARRFYENEVLQSLKALPELPTGSQQKEIVDKAALATEEHLNRMKEYANDGKPNAEDMAYKAEDAERKAKAEAEDAERKAKADKAIADQKSAMSNIMAAANSMPKTHMISDNPELDLNAKVEPREEPPAKPTEKRFDLGYALLDVDKAILNWAGQGGPLGYLMHKIGDMMARDPQHVIDQINSGAVGVHPESIVGKAIIEHQHERMRQHKERR